MPRHSNGNGGKVWVYQVLGALASITVIIAGVWTMLEPLNSNINLLYRRVEKLEGKVEKATDSLQRETMRHITDPSLHHASVGRLEGRLERIQTILDQHGQAIRDMARGLKEH